MSNGARHTWGFFAGVVLTAALAALLIFGTYRLQHGYVTQFHKQDKWIGGGLIAAAAVVFGLMAASRLSPLTSLVGGVVLTLAGVLFFVSQKTTADLINRFPFKEQRVTLAGLEEEGFILFAGVGLLFASFFPSRWRGRATSSSSSSDDDADAAAASRSGYEYGLPERREPYRDPSLGEPVAGRHTGHDEQPPAYGGYDQGYEQGGGYDQGYDPQRTSYDPQRSGYEAPLHEPTQQQPQYGSGRSPFSPPDEGGGTQEMRRPR